MAIVMHIPILTPKMTSDRPKSWNISSKSERVKVSTFPVMSVRLKAWLAISSDHTGSFGLGIGFGIGTLMV